MMLHCSHSKGLPLQQDLCDEVRPHIAYCGEVSQFAYCPLRLFFLAGKGAQVCLVRLSVLYLFASSLFSSPLNFGASAFDTCSEIESSTVKLSVNFSSNFCPHSKTSRSPS